MSRVRSSRASKVTLPPAASFAGSAPATILEWLDLRFPRVGREVWARRITRGAVSLEARGRERELQVTLEQPYAAGRRLRYFREVEAVDEPVIPFTERIVHHDEHLLVADKPPFLPVVPSGPFVRECLLERLRARFATELAPLHRLDRLTSGLVMFARRSEDRGIYGELFAHRKIRKDYFAVARMHRPPPGESWTVRSRIVAGEPFFRMAEDPSGPANAVTEVRLVRYRPEAGTGLFHLRPLTGKTHQLRLHMSRLGWPISNDPLYPELREKAPDDPARPLRLVAARLRFQDPVTGESRDFASRFEVENLPSAAS